MIFRQKKIKKNKKNFKIIIFRVDFVPQSQHPSVSSPTPQYHPERCASSYALASKNDSGSHHSSTKPLIPGFPIRSSSSSSQAPPAVDCSPQALQSLPLHKKFYAHKNTKKNCIKHQNRIKEFLPKTGCIRMFILTENQFSSCVLSQEEVDLQEYHIGAKDLVTP